MSAGWRHLVVVSSREYRIVTLVTFVKYRTRLGYFIVPYSTATGTNPSPGGPAGDYLTSTRTGAEQVVVPR